MAQLRSSPVSFLTSLEALEPRRLLAATIYDLSGVPMAGTVTVVAGEALHVRALANTSVPAGTTGNDLFFNTRYKWTFTDPGPASNAYGEYNPDLNIVVGFNAAHVWDRPTAPGSPYRVTLGATRPNGVTETAVLNVNVVANPTERPFRTLYVNTSGNDVNPGTSSTAPIRTLGKLNKLLQTTYADGYVKVLFQAGQTFEYAAATTAPALDVNRPHLMFDWYGATTTGGTQQRPVLKDMSASQPNRTFFQCGQNTRYLSIRHLQFSDVTNPNDENGYAVTAVSANGAFNNTVGSRNVTVRDCTPVNVGNVVMVDDFRFATGVLVQGVK